MLEGKRIRLRPLKIEDLEKTHEWRNNLELIILTQGIRFPKTLEMDKEWFDVVLNDKSNRNIYFGIDEIGSNNFIGIIQLNSIDYISCVADLGIIIGDCNVKGKGYGTESINILLKYAFDILNLRKICLKVTSENEIAINLYRNTGFGEEGRLINHIYLGGAYVDVIIMSIFKDEYNKRNEY